MKVIGLCQGEEKKRLSYHNFCNSLPSMAEPTTDAQKPNSTAPPAKTPVVILFIGMAGSGKTTLVYSFSKFLKKTSKKPYIINLDPAVTSIPYKVKIDIRDSVNYADTMSQFALNDRSHSSFSIQSKTWPKWCHSNVSQFVHDSV